jgi:hypothetical protein
MPKPIPLAPPVTNAIFPEMSFMGILRLGLFR